MSRESTLDQRITFRQGDVIQCVCDGPDEKEALEAMKEILAKDLEE